MDKKDGESDKNEKKKRYGLKILGVTGGCSAIGILNHFFDIIKPEALFQYILLAVCIILVCFVLLQDTILGGINRICICIERTVKFREETKRINAKFEDGGEGGEDDDGDCKIYKMHRSRKTK